MLSSVFFVGEDDEREQRVIANEVPILLVAGSLAWVRRQSGAARSTDHALR